MSIPAFVSGFKTFGTHTEAAGTVITEDIPGSNSVTLALIELLITTGVTAHLGSLMYAQGTGTRVVTTATAASGQKVMSVSVAPKDPAGNATASGDIIAYQLPSGAWEFNVVDSLATLAITLTTNIAVSLAVGAKVRIFGIVADGSLFNIHALASVVTKAGEGNIHLVHPFIGDPWYLSSNNATNAGFLNNAVFGYINKNGGGAT